MKIDPAIMAGPLITSIVDTASLAIYFLLAKLILNI
jgi:magnesium transporter